MLQPFLEFPRFNNMPLKIVLGAGRDSRRCTKKWTEDFSNFGMTHWAWTVDLCRIFLAIQKYPKKSKSASWFYWSAPAAEAVWPCRWSAGLELNLSLPPHGACWPLSTRVPVLSPPALWKLLKKNNADLKRNSSSPVVRQFFFFSISAGNFCQRFSIRETGVRPASRPSVAAPSRLVVAFLSVAWPTPVPGSPLDAWLTPTPSSVLAAHWFPDLCFSAAPAAFKNTYSRLSSPFFFVQPCICLPTVSTGASLRPSAWVSGRFAPGNLAQTSSCCHAVSVCFPQGLGRVYWCTTVPSALTLTEIPPTVLNLVQAL